MEGETGEWTPRKEQRQICVAASASHLALKRLSTTEPVQREISYSDEIVASCAAACMDQICPPTHRKFEEKKKFTIRRQLLRLKTRRHKLHLRTRSC